MERDLEGTPEKLLHAQHVLPLDCGVDKALQKYT